MTITLANRTSAFGTERDGETFNTAEEMLAAAGMLGWNVEKRLALADLGGGKTAEIPNRWATVRMDTGQPLGVVRGAYAIIQPEEAFAFGDLVLDQPGRNWMQAGDFKGGEVIFGALRLGDLAFSLPNDPGGLEPYLLIVNSFGGSTNYEAIITWIRVACWNTFQAARHSFHSRFRLRHTGNLQGKVLAAREALGVTFQHVEQEAKPLFTAMAKAKIVDEQVREIFRETVWPITDTQREKGLKGDEDAELGFAHYLTSDTLEGIRGTAWGAYQSVTEFLDHREGEYKRRVQRHTAEQQRQYVLMFGTGAEKKDRALEAFASFVKR